MLSIEESCANDGEVSENKKKVSVVLTITLTSSCHLLHGLPFSNLIIFAESAA